jgi:hypothetical protein
MAASDGRRVCGSDTANIGVATAARHGVTSHSQRNRVMQRTDNILRMIERLGQMLIHLRKQILGQVDSERFDEELNAIARTGSVDIEVARLATADTGGVHLLGWPEASERITEIRKLLDE